MSAATDAQFLVLSVGCLILAIASYRAQRVGAKQTLFMALAWGAIFLLVAAVFSAAS